MAASSGKVMCTQRIWSRPRGIAGQLAEHRTANVVGDPLADPVGKLRRATHQRDRQPLVRKTATAITRPHVAEQLQPQALQQFIHRALTVGLAEPRNPTHSDRQASDRHRSPEHPPHTLVQGVLQ